MKTRVTGSLVTGRIKGGRRGGRLWEAGVQGARLPETPAGAGSPSSAHCVFRFSRLWPDAD